MHNAKVQITHTKTVHKPPGQTLIDSHQDYASWHCHTRYSEWDVSATPVRRRRFGDGQFGDWTIRRQDSSAMGQFGANFIGLFGDRRFWVLCVSRTVRRPDVSAIILP